MLIYIHYIVLIIFILLSFSYCLYAGIDINENQGQINWEILSLKNKHFALIRAGLNFDEYDKLFEINYKEAKKYNFQIGAYWVSYAHNEEEAAREAKGCLEALKGKQFEYPIYYVIKKEETFNTGLANEILDTFCNVLEKAGYYCGVYSQLYNLNSYFDQNILNKYSVWVAAWNSGSPTIPYDIWQAGKVYYPGVGDINDDVTDIDFGPYMKENHLNGF